MPVKVEHTDGIPSLRIDAALSNICDTHSASVLQTRPRGVAQQDAAIETTADH